MFNRTTRIYSSLSTPDAGGLSLQVDRPEPDGDALGHSDNAFAERLRLVSAEALLGQDLSSLISGRYHRMAMSPDFYIGIWDVVFKRDAIMSTPMTHHLCLDFVSEGGCERLYGTRVLKNGNAPRIYFSKFGEDEIHQRLFKAGDSYRGVSIWLSPQTLVSQFGLQPARLPQLLRQQLEGDQTRTEILPLSLPMKGIVDAILCLKFDGLTRARHVQAKVNELLCHTVERLYQGQGTEAGFLSPSKVSGLARVMAKLNADYHAPPGLDELARLAGLSRTNLCTSFKAACGMTISDYTRNRRMEMSRLMLSSGRRTILQVALAVGYRDQSSFTRAYRNHFNRPPKTDLARA